MKGGKSTDAKHVYVFSEIDGIRYKLVMEGDISLLTVAKIKRYLENATGLSCQQQELLFNGKVLQDDYCGGDIGLADGVVLRMRHINAARHAKRSNASVPPCRLQSTNSAGRCGVSSLARLSRSVPSTIGVYTPRQGSNDRCSHDSGDEIARASRGCLTSSAKRTECDCHATAEAKDVSPGRRSSCQEEQRCGSVPCCDRRLREEVEELRNTVARLLMDKNNAERLAREKWVAKVEELVKELDVLREERRKLYRERVLAEQEHRAVVCALEQQIQSQQKELLELKETRQLPRRGCSRCMESTVAQRVENSLKQLSVELDIPDLQLDDNDSCVLPLGDSTNILLTLDTATERLFMYAVIAKSLPLNTEHRLRLFETLLDGALLGREMAGGGVGVCLRNDLAIMDVCIDMAHVDEYALANIARPFIESVQHWIGVVNGITVSES